MRGREGILWTLMAQRTTVWSPGKEPLTALSGTGRAENLGTHPSGSYGLGTKGEAEHQEPQHIRVCACQK